METNRYGGLRFQYRCPMVFYVNKLPGTPGGKESLPDRSLAHFITNQVLMVMVRTKIDFYIDLNRLPHIHAASQHKVLGE